MPFIFSKVALIRTAAPPSDRPSFARLAGKWHAASATASSKVRSRQTASLTSPGQEHCPYQSEDQARKLGLQPQSLKIAGASPELQRVFDAMRREHADALVVLSEPATVVHRMRIAKMAAKQRLPTLVPNAAVDAGGLIGYGTNLTLAVRRIAAHVDKIICKGANPADLPFEVLVHPELIVNLKTANEIGIAIRPDVLKRANRLIQ